jgi:hypothetical protein
MNSLCSPSDNHTGSATLVHILLTLRQQHEHRPCRSCRAVAGLAREGWMRTTTLLLLWALVLDLPALTQSGQPANREPSPVAGSTASATMADGLMLIFLRPAIHFEQLSNSLTSDWGTAIEANRRGTQQHSEWADEYESVLLEAAKRGVSPKLNPVDLDTRDSAVADVCEKLRQLTSRLARGNVNDEALKDLADLAALNEHYAVLVQFLRLETGPGRSWNPNTGAITSSTDSTLIQAALLSGKTGKVIWKGERLIRNKALRPTDSAFNKALTELYRDFNIK